MEMIKWCLRDPREEERKLLSGCPAEETRTPEEMVAGAESAYRAFASTYAYATYTTDRVPDPRPILFDYREISHVLPALKRVEERRAESAAYHQLMADLLAPAEAKP
jgi:hypothetical protein